MYDKRDKLFTWQALLGLSHGLLPIGGEAPAHLH